MKQPLFLFSELTEKEKQKESQAVNVKNARNKAVLGKRYDKCRQVIGKISMGDCIHYVSMGEWSLHDLVFHLLSITGPAEITMATWSVSEDAVRLMLKNIEHGLIKKLSLLLDWRVKVRRPEVLSLVKSNITEIRESSCHAKLAVIENDGWQICIVGSANLTNNPRIEAGVIHADKNAADFHKKWMDAEIRNADPFGAKKL